ncbi:hypothetical protein LJC72_01990 [Bacteroides sp. OttesenSCG-928-D19]|nr:hypothetical protein [Bacteroides sp. OttesenSCG-928-D19]
MLNNLQEHLHLLWQTLLSLLKIVLQSGKVAHPVKVDNHSQMVVLGNGPSLRNLIAEKRTFLQNKALLAVNYAVLSDYYQELKPQYYLVADPVFFFTAQHCDKLFDALATKINWPVELYLSNQAKKATAWKQKLANNPHITVHYFNMTPVEGYKWFTHWAFRKGLGSPRPRNVLIPSIMVSLRMDYETIYIAGADHSWLKEIWVNDDNVVMEDLQHFYDKKGAERYVSDHHLHDLLYSMYIAFKSYHIIEAYARSMNRKIYNVTPGSYIDAFERKKID